MMDSDWLADWVKLQQVVATDEGESKSVESKGEDGEEKRLGHVKSQLMGLNETSGATASQGSKTSGDKESTQSKGLVSSKSVLIFGSVAPEMEVNDDAFLTKHALQLGISVDRDDLWEPIHYTVDGNRLLITEETSGATSDVTVSACYFAENTGNVRFVSTSGNLFVWWFAQDYQARKFISMMKHNIEKIEGKESMAKKEELLHKIQPLLEEQIHDLRNMYDDINCLADLPGQLLNLNPLGNVEKSLEGSLNMHVVDLEGETDVETVYAVIVGNHLYIYEKTQDSIPSRTVLLDNAIIKPCPEDIEKGNCCFDVISPLQRYKMEAQHPIVLDVWICALKEGAKQEISEEDRDFSAKSRAARTWTQFDGVVEDQLAMKYFQRFVENAEKEEHKNMLAFFMAVSKHQASWERFLRLKDKRQAAKPTESKEMDNIAEAEEDDAEEEEEEEEDHPELNSLQESCVEISSTFYDKEAEEFISILAPFASKVDDLIDEQKFGDCFVESLECVRAALKEELFPKFLESAYFSDLMASQQDPFGETRTMFGQKQLTVRHNGGEARTYELKEGPTMIGRDWTNDVVLDHGKVSRTHCVIEIDDLDRCIIKDLGSRHGTFVNGRSIQQKGLVLGDEIQICDFSLQVVINLKF